MDEMEKANRIDMANLRRWRNANSVLEEILREETIHLTDFQRDSIKSARTLSRQRAEHLEAVWN